VRYPNLAAIAEDGERGRKYLQTKSHEVMMAHL